MSQRIAGEDLPVRLIAPAYTLGISDGQLNGTPEMRFSLSGRNWSTTPRPCTWPRTKWRA